MIPSGSVTCCQQIVTFPAASTVILSTNGKLVSKPSAQSARTWQNPKSNNMINPNFFKISL